MRISVLRFSALTFTLFTAACAASHAPASAPTLSSTNAENASCESQIRQQMESKSISFASDPHLAAAPDFAALNQTTDSFSQVNHQTQSLSVKHTDGSAHALEYELSINDKDSADAMSLSVSYQEVSGDLSRTSRQTLGVAGDCTLHLQQTSIEDYRVAGEGYDFKLDTYYSDGGADHHSNHFDLSSGQHLVNFGIEGDAPGSYTKGAVVYSDGAGLLTLKVTHLAPSQDNEFGVALQFDNLEYEAIANGKTFLTATYANDASKQISLTTYLGHAEWQTPRAIWLQQSLGTASGLSNVVDLKLAADYLPSHDSFAVTGTIPTYEHLSAYFGVTKTSGGFLFTENSVPTIRDSTSPDDLASNATLDTTLPEIQRIASSIKNQTSDRRQQVALILAYLHDHYSYDEDMAKNNVIRPMSVAEALARHKGVCQHYAVIFATLARALGVPARIIEGFLLVDGQAGGHAWNEVEIEPGVWQVIEPQKLNALTETYTRYYIPIAHARFLEDPKASLADDVRAMYSVQMQITPIN